VIVSYHQHNQVQNRKAGQNPPRVVAPTEEEEEEHNQVERYSGNPTGIYGYSALLRFES